VWPPGTSPPPKTWTTEARDGRRGDDDVVRTDGDSNGDVRPEHRDNSQFADAKARESLEDAADAVVGESLEVATPRVLVAVSVAVGAGYGTVLGGPDAGDAGFGRVVWHAAVRRHRRILRRVRLPVAEVCFEQQIRRREERKREQCVEQGLRNHEREERAGDDERNSPRTRLSASRRSTNPCWMNASDELESPNDSLSSPIFTSVSGSRGTRTAGRQR